MVEFKSGNKDNNLWKKWWSLSLVTEIITYGRNGGV